MATRAPQAAGPPGSGRRPLPGDGGPPLVGHTLRYLRDPVSWARARYDRYGPVSWTRAFGKPILNLLGPDAAEVVLVNRDRAFSQGGWRHWIGPFFHRGLMLLDGEEHLHHRRIMQHAFTRSRLRDYLRTLTPAIAREVGGWEASDRFLAYPALKQLTLNLATSVFMGHDPGAESERVNGSFVDTVRAGTGLVRFPAPGTRWWRGVVGRRHLERFFHAELASKRADDGDDLLSALCHAETEDGQRFDADDVVNHMIFLMMAAHDTSTITLTTMLYELGRSTEWQERLREESRALGDVEPNLDDLAALGSLDLVMRESMRKLAPVPVLARKTVADTEVLGHAVPAGMLASVMPSLTHLMPEYWPHPERFDPERFAPHRREDAVHPYAWMPFGGGVHKCIGLHFGQMEIKAVMHHILLRWRWQVEPGYEVPVDMTALPRPRDGLPVQLAAL